MFIGVMPRISSVFVKGTKVKEGKGIGKEARLGNMGSLPPLAIQDEIIIFFLSSKSCDRV